MVHLPRVPSFFRNRRLLPLLVAFVAVFSHGSWAKQAPMLLAEEEKPSAASVSMAATLLGSISFIMCLYYFTNWPDPDIKRYSWQIVSSTISIFCAVLLFQSFNDLVTAYIIEAYEFGPLGKLAVDMTHMLIWFTFLQLLLCYFSGAVTVDYDKLKEDEEALAENLESRELNMKCYATLMAHLTGFASINAWGSLQQLPFFAQNGFLAMSTVLFAFLGQCTLQRITAAIRERVCLGDDGEKDPFEEMWDDETEEAENDVMGLTLSFMVVNAWRFIAVGCLPNSEGKEESPGCPEGALYNHTMGNKIVLWGSAFFFTALVFLMHYNFPEEWETTRLPVKPAVAKRICEDLMVSVSMCFSWATFYGVQMILAGNAVFHGEDEMLSVVLALVCSLGVFACLIPLDWLADQDWTDDQCDEAIRATMDAFALLVGFAWEQCFDQSVDSIAGDTANPHKSKLVLSVFCAGLLVPAWKWYMLPYILREGWKYGIVTVPEDLEKIFEQMLEEDHHVQEDNHEESKTLEVIHSIHQRSIGKLPIFKGYVPPEHVPDKSQAETAEGLRKRVADLEAALAKAEAERDSAQNMVAYQMEAMLENMKKLNLTVTRIP